MSKSAQSGLKSVKRNWSTAGGASQEMYCPPAPLSQQSPITTPLTAQEQRLKIIQAALSGNKSEPAQIAKSQPLSESRLINKRPSDPTEPPTVTKKARKMPSSWKDEDALSKPTAYVSKSKQATASTKPIRPPSSSSVSSSTSVGPGKKQKLAKVFLSQEQMHILQLAQEGSNVFYTGSAGTGKSVLLREIIKTLRNKYVKHPDAVAVTASTGIAACNVGGVTVHSFAGIGLGLESVNDLASKIKKNKKAYTRWKRTKVLIIDEVSMVDGELFDKLEGLGRTLRKEKGPFGGIQVIVTGDFFQLPPVSKAGPVKFAFEAETWSDTIQHTFNLTKVFRQSDQEFVDMLNEMRFGRLSQQAISKFKSLSRPLAFEDGLDATELFPRREDVDKSNSTRIARLNTQEMHFVAVDAGVIQDPAQREKILSNMMAPQRLSLRLDAQVMLIKNVDDTLVNGTMGRVIRFVDPTVYQTQYDPESELGGEGAIGNNTSSVGSAAKKGGPGVGTGKKYPVVEFVQSNGFRRTMLVMPEVWKVELPSGEVQASRTQLPLILSWAMSIHKAQGQTLDRVKVDLGKVFERGQAYVALSRATSLEGLQVLNFDPRKVTVHPKVAEWSKTLSTIEIRASS
ncbi:hypothetical protein AX16_006549 [Volvariella volvacea WC 439]|nr:hypothetical protein AX16_006549 [Volvariella volvacea WC 439]